MTCETPDGKVLESRQITVGRGQTVKANFGQCHAGGAVLGQKKSRHLTKRQACLRRASHVRGKAKRHKAIARCRKRYPAHKKTSSHG